MNLIGHIPGVGPTANFNPGAATPAPWNVPHTGAVDGTGPASATKNMAEVYNRLLLQTAAAIQKSGLAIDNTNWAQLGEAMQKMATDAAAGITPGLGFKNKAINTDFNINQDAYVSGVALAAGVYGHDGWKAGAGGCTYTFVKAGGITTITITAGTLLHPIEPDLVDQAQVTTSWVGTAQGRIGAGAYAASPFTTAALVTGTGFNIEFGLGTLTKLQNENGAEATTWERASPAVGMTRCQWFYYLGKADFAMPSNLSSGATNGFRVCVTHPTPMRAVPAVTIVSQTQADRAGGPLGMNTSTNRNQLCLQADVAAASGVAQWGNVNWKCDCRL